MSRWKAERPRKENLEKEGVIKSSSLLRNQVLQLSRMNIDKFDRNFGGVLLPEDLFRLKESEERREWDNIHCE